MLLRAIMFFFISIALVGSAYSNSPAIDLTSGFYNNISSHVEFYKEKKNRLTLEEVVASHRRGEFSLLHKSFLNFGIGSDPVWIRIQVNNPSDRVMQRRLVVENSWLDEIDVYFRQGGQTIREYYTGDKHPFAQRPIHNRFFAFDHTFHPGTSTVYLRISTPDPLMLPIYIMSPEYAHTREMIQAYSYGIIYGFILALALYNLTLFFSLHNVRYLYYTIYLGCFLILNISYTGHGFKWLWPESTEAQIWLNPVLMMLYAFTGLLFATRFLTTRRNFPRIHRRILLTCATFASLLVISILFRNHALALYLAFVFIFLFTGIMLFLGIISVYKGSSSAKYFLVASISAMIGTTVTALAVWGGIPYNGWTYRAAEIGMLIDSVLLAMALADQFRTSQEEKIQAERLAKVDPLTSMNNRRALYDTTKPIWSTAVRHDRAITVILMDIDHFKNINDTYGHAQGDNVLIKIARFLHASAREGDILARWGGEEFIIFLPETSLKEATIIAERLRKAIKNVHISIDDTNLVITASFGVACKSADTRTLDEVISLADRQLYRAKHEGRDRVCAVSETECK